MEYLLVLALLGGGSWLHSTLRSLKFAVNNIEERLVRIEQVVKSGR